MRRVPRLSFSANDICHTYPEESGNCVSYLGTLYPNPIREYTIFARSRERFPDVERRSYLPNSSDNDY